MAALRRPAGCPVAVRRARRAAALPALLLLLGCGGEVPPPPGDAGAAVDLAAAEEQAPAPEGIEPVWSVEEAAAALRTALADRRLPRLDRRGMPPAREQLAELYRDGEVPVWVGPTGRPGPAARDALSALRDAGSEGLRPADYGVARLDSLVRLLDAAATPDPRRIGQFDAALSAGVLRFATDLHAGRIEPRSVGFALALPGDLHNIPAMVAVAVRDRRMAETVEQLRPPLVQYRRLREALTRYRALADSAVDPIPEARTAVRPGEAWDGIPALRRRLVLEGDLDRAAPASGTAYDSLLAAAVRRFQDRHGLEPDGVLGRASIAALNVPFARRVTQLELGLERLRWLPDLGGSRFIVVNIPTFQLWAWDSLSADGLPSLAMNVVVGRSMRTGTPVLREELAYLVFRPYWNVPRSIAVGEVVPQARGDPGYLARNNMELVAGGGEDGTVLAATPENLERLARGHLRVRQRPGPWNSLGLVKFIFPNDQAVYLHDTPATEQFSRARRDFSHGCVRVERPVDLAEWALRDRPEWTRDRIVDAMQRGVNRTVTLPRPIPVILFYTTTIADPAEGTVRFFEDIYGHDARLLRALEAP